MTDFDSLPAIETASFIESLRAKQDLQREGMRYARYDVAPYASSNPAQQRMVLVSDQVEGPTRLMAAGNLKALVINNIDQLTHELTSAYTGMLCPTFGLRDQSAERELLANIGAHGVEFVAA